MLCEKIYDLLAESNVNEIIAVKGQLRNIQKKQKDGLFFYTADLKIPKNLNEDVYQVSFNSLNVCLNTEYVQKNKISDDYMKSFKDNEVIALLSQSAYVDRQKRDGVEYVNNRITLYVQDLILSRKVETQKNFSQYI